jgi:hypothetical protein
VQLAHRGARFDAELLDEGAPQALVRLEGIGLPVRPVLGEHEVGPQALAQRMRPYQCLQLADQREVPAQPQLRVDPLFQHGQAALLQPGHVGLDRVQRDPVERRTAPQRQRLGEEGGGLLRAGPGGGVDQPLEAVQVQLVRPDLQEVPGCAGDHGLAIGAPERPAQPGHAALQQVARGSRRLLTPQVIHEPVGGHHAACVEQQYREQRALLRPAQRQPAPGGDHLQRAQDGKPHTSSPVRREAGER